MLHINKDKVDALWSRIECGLSRAIDKTTLGEFWDMESLRDYLLSDKLFGFYQTQSGYAGIYSISDTPKARQLTFFWSGKDQNNDNKVDYNEVAEHLNEVATIFGCTHISCEGRVGWKKILEPLGYSTDGSLYLKRL